MIDKESLVTSLHEVGAVQFGSFTLPTGEQSPLYIDLQALVTRPATLRRVARIMQSMAAPLAFDRLAAIPTGGLSMGLAYSLTADVPLIYPRPNPNTSAGRYLAGSYKAGETVLLIDDLLAHAAAKLDTIALLETVRLKVKDVMVLLDRGLGGREVLAAKGYQVHSVLTMSDVLDTLLALHRISADQHRFVTAWLAEQAAAQTPRQPVGSRNGRPQPQAT